MARNKINDLRDHLFETIEALKDADKPMELDRALAISKVAQTIIESAKVEVELMKTIYASAPSTALFEDVGAADPRRAALPPGKPQ